MTIKGDLRLVVVTQVFSQKRPFLMYFGVLSNHYKNLMKVLFKYVIMHIFDLEEKWQKRGQSKLNQKIRKNRQQNDITN